MGELIVGCLLIPVYHLPGLLLCSAWWCALGLLHRELPTPRRWQLHVIGGAHAVGGNWFLLLAYMHRGFPSET